MAISCERFRELLERNMVDGKELDEEEYRDIDEHEATCPVCRPLSGSCTTPIKDDS